MSHEKGRIYIDTSTTPDTGVSFYDVQTTIGSGSHDLGTLCQHRNINMLSIRKPTPYQGFDSGATQAAYIASGANYDFYAGGIYKATTIVMDTQYPSASVGTMAFVSNLHAPSGMWQYQAPSYPAKFRLLDFNEYLHSGCISYPQTAAKWPYITGIDYGISNGVLSVAIMLRFNLTNATLYGTVAGLLGMKDLLAEKDTSMSNLNLRYGFILRVKSASEGGYEERDTPLSMLFISSDNLTNYGYQSDGIYSVTANTNGMSIFVSSATQIDSTHIFGAQETAQIYPIIAKRYHSGSGTGDNCWLCYGFGATTPPVLNAPMSGRTFSSSGGTAAGTEIKLTLLIKQNGDYVFYIKDEYDFYIYFGLIPSDDEVFGTIPISFGAGENCISGKPAEICLGTQDTSSSYWHVTRGPHRATSIIGWSSTADPENRAGSLIVKPMATTFTLTLCINTVKNPRQHTFSVNTSTAQTGDEFDWQVSNQ